MKTENAVLMLRARETLKGKWGLAVGTFFVFQLLLIGVQSIPDVGGLFYIIISGPMSLGMALFALKFSRNQNPKLEEIFDGFKRFGVSLVASLLVTVFVALWTILLIVPGIIAALAYSMTFYILAENNSITASEALRKSKQMMYGYKWKLFCLHLRFIGWLLLSILTLGIGFLWLTPYVAIAKVKFYEDIKDRVVPPPAPISA